MIGSLRQRITIEQPARVADGAGGFTESWTAVATVWASLEPLSAKERMFAGKLEHNITHRVKMRHRSDIQPKMRIVYGSRTFQIHGVINMDERGKMLDLSCEEGVGS